MTSILQNRAAVVGAPALLFGCALVVGVASALSGFDHPLPFVVLCFIAGATLLFGGLTTLTGFSRVFHSRGVGLAVGAAYTGLGLLTLLVGLVFYGLMNTCWVCL
jgi:hypothetical protein